MIDGDLQKEKQKEKVRDPLRGEQASFGCCAAKCPEGVGTGKETCTYFSLDQIKRQLFGESVAR